MAELWRKIPEAPDYSVSSLGRVRRDTDGVNTWAGRILTPAIVRGYLAVGINTADGRKLRKVHTIVCESFHGPRPTPAHQVAHNDGDRTNNTKDNLRWATSKENHADRIGHGTAPKGEANGRSKLTQEAADYIRSLPKQRGQNQMLAERYGVSVKLIDMVRAKNSPIWRRAA